MIEASSPSRVVVAMAGVVALIGLALGACAGVSPAATSGPCAAQICESDDGGCDAIVLENRWTWNGEACVEAYASGCGVVGPDCDALYASQAACEAAWSSCLAASP